MICDNCGANIKETDKFCSQCGTANSTKINTQINSAGNVRIGNFVFYDVGASPIKPGDYVQVVDNASQKVVMQGIVSCEKIQCPDGKGNSIELSDDEKILTLDDSYFFKLDDDRYTVRRLPENFIDKNFIRKNYAIKSWRSCTTTGCGDANMFIEHTINELDKEVESIVHTLNRFSLHMRTTGSCSGHDKRHAWVNLQFKNTRALEDFMCVFEPFKSKMSVTFENDIAVPTEMFQGNAFFPNHLVMRLVTRAKGDPAYKTIDEFDAYLNRVIDFRNRTFASLDEIIANEKEQQLLHKE